MPHVRTLENLFHDWRYALRGLRQNPGFSAVTVLTLTLGMGASIAVLTVVNAVLIRPLPFPAADRLMALAATTPTRSRDSASYPDFLDWQAQTQSFTGVAAYRSDPFILTGGGPPEPLTGLRVSDGFLSVLGISPAIGRMFDPQEQHQQSAVALISYGLWFRRFGGDPGVLGRTIVLNGVNYSVIGVLPESFRFREAFRSPPVSDAEVLVPIAESSDRSRGYLFGIARLKPGVRQSVAQSELDTVALRLQRAYPTFNRGRGVRIVSLQEAAAGSVRVPLLILMGAGFLVLLIGCANVGNLMLARGIARRREFVVRTALGAGAGRLVRQLLTESAVLALLAAIVGAAFAAWGSKLLAASLAQRFALPGIGADARLFFLAILIMMICGLLCGLPPAMMVWRSRAGNALHEASRGQSAGRSEYRLRNLLVVAEVALTFVLLAGAALLIKSFIRLQQTDLGLNPHHVLMADLVLAKRYEDPQRREAFLTRVLDSVASLPGVQDAAIHTDPPFLGAGSRETFHVDGRPDPGPRQGHVAAFNVVSDGFFRAMGIPMVRGRDFDVRDKPEGAPVAIVNAAMARQFWPDADPTGKRIRLYYDRDPQHWLTIVGVAGDVRYHGLDSDPVPQVFVPDRQQPYRSLPYPRAPFASLVLRTTADSSTLIQAVQARIWAVDKDQPVLHVQSMEQALAQSLADRRVYLLLLGFFATAALLMAIAGIYGVISYAVARRTREMGIRFALGASAGQMLTLVLRDGLALTSIGVAAGVIGALALTRLLSGLLFGITATDPLTFVETAALFVWVALLATIVPARRAARIDPAVAFREE